MDKEESLGHLVGATHGRPLIHEDDVRGVGKRADNALAAAKKQVPGAVATELAASTISTTTLMSAWYARAPVACTHLGPRAIRKRP